MPPSDGHLKGAPGRQFEYVRKDLADDDNGKIGKFMEISIASPKNPKMLMTLGEMLSIVRGVEGWMETTNIWYQVRWNIFTRDHGLLGVGCVREGRLYGGGGSCCFGQTAPDDFDGDAL